MKRLVPPSLITFWQNNPTCHRADCTAITLPTGQTIHVTSGQWDITFLPSTPGWTGGQVTFYATKYGVWTRGKITSEATTKCSSNTMDLTCVPQQATKYPGTQIGILAAAANHLFDAAKVWVYTAYMPIGQYGNVSAGIETKFQGSVSQAPKIQRNVVLFECGDPFYLMNMKVPARILQSNCPWGFADVNCTLAASDYTVQFRAAGNSQVSLTPTTAFTQPAGYFAQGVCTCLTGANAGLSQTVKTYAGGVLTLTLPFLAPVAPGDTFSVIKGCDKTPTTCADTAKTDGTPEPKDFRVRFGGTPLIPPPSLAI